MDQNPNELKSAEKWCRLARGDRARPGAIDIGLACGVALVGIAQSPLAFRT